MAILLIFIVVWLICYSLKVKYFENKYIDKHKKMVKEISDYEKYVKYCEKVNDIPLCKQDFENPLNNKRKKYKELIEGY
jgi:uncharacterized short protein YbdD (DUF466 family)